MGLSSQVLYYENTISGNKPATKKAHSQNVNGLLHEKKRLSYQCSVSADFFIIAKAVQRAELPEVSTQISIFTTYFSIPSFTKIYRIKDLLSPTVINPEIIDLTVTDPYRPEHIINTIAIGRKAGRNK